MPSFNFTFQDPSPLISRTLRWTSGDREHDTLFTIYDKTSRSANRNNIMASFSFKGTGISIHGILRPTHGNYTVALDGSHQSTISGSGSNGSALWEDYNLGYGSHVVEITNQLSESNQDSYLDIDLVQIQRDIGQKNDMIYSATLHSSSPFIAFTHGVWKPFVSSHSREEKHTVQTVSPNAKFTINFQGCCIELYGAYANAGYNVSLDDQSPVPMQGKNASLTNTNIWHPKTLLYMVDGLAEDVNHTVTVSTLSSTSDNSPFFFDHAVIQSTQSFISGTPFQTRHNENTGFLETSASPSSSVPVHHHPAVIIGVIAGGIVLLALIGITMFFLYRRRKRHPPLRLDLLEEVDLPKMASAPVPWLLLRPARSPGSISSTWQLSSVISGVRRLSLDQTETGITPSTLSRSGFRSSVTPSAQSSPLSTRLPRPQQVRLNIANR